MGRWGRAWILLLALAYPLAGCSDDNGSESIPVNRPPVAVAGTDRNVLTGTPVVLDGLDSHDPDNDQLAFSWMLLEQPPASQTAIVDMQSPKPVLTPDLPGDYMVQLTVSDGQTVSSPDTVTIRAKAPGTNQQPIADAGPDLDLRTDSPATLDGSASHDPDGDPLFFNWIILSQPEGSVPFLSDPTAKRPIFQTNSAGEYEIQLIVSDGWTESAADTARLIVPDAIANSAPVARAGKDQTVHVWDLVLLDGRGSSDPDGDPLFFDWVIVSQPATSMVTLSAADTANPSFTPLVPGDYDIRMTVRDDRSAAAIDFVLVTAVAVTTNISPVADAGPDRAVPIDTVVNLDGSASEDPDGSILTYAWSFAARPAGSFAVLSESKTARPFFTPDQNGDYRIVLTVSDIFGASATDTVIVTALSPGSNAPPTADAGEDRIIFAGSVVTLDGRGSRDPEGGPLSYDWELSAPVLSDAVLQNAETPTPYFFADVPGEYLARLTVRDDQGNPATDTTRILVR